MNEGDDGVELGQNQPQPGAEAVWQLPGPSTISCAAVAPGLVVLADSASRVRSMSRSFSCDAPLHRVCAPLPQCWTRIEVVKSNGCQHPAEGRAGFACQRSTCAHGSASILASLEACCCTLVLSSCVSHEFRSRDVLCQGMVVLRVGRDEGHAASPGPGHAAASKRKRASMCWQLRQAATLDVPAPVSCISLQPCKGPGLRTVRANAKMTPQAASHTC